MQPPTFVFFVNDPSLIADDYKRYMERSLRENIGLNGTPVRLLWRGKPEQDRSTVRVRPPPGSNKGKDSKDDAKPRPAAKA